MKGRREGARERDREWGREGEVRERGESEREDRRGGRVRERREGTRRERESVYIYIVFHI